MTKMTKKKRSSSLNSRKSDWATYLLKLSKMAQKNHLFSEKTFYRGPA